VIQEWVSLAADGQALAYIREALIVFAATLIFTAAIGLLRFRESGNIVYARIHIVGVMDVACILLAFLLGYPLVGLTFFILTPLVSHLVGAAHHQRAGGGGL
jgi:energy-converting hydrogenase B subunit C